MHLSYNYMTAHFENNENRHAQEVMKELGIKYQHITFQSLGDQVWFWNCENIPESLPKFITELKINPIDWIGFGLSEEDAEKISDYKKEKKC